MTKWKKFEGAAAWEGQSIERLEDEWAFVLDPQHLEEIEAAFLASRGVPLEAIRSQDFPLPTLSAHLRRQGEEIERGRGFSLIRGLPVHTWDLDKWRRIYWGISVHLGRPISQSPLGDLFNTVTDMGFEKTDANYRANRGRGELFFHSDGSDVVGLLCVRTAKTGGVSRLVSSMTVYNTMVDECPQHLDTLRRGYHFYRKLEQPVGEPEISADRLPMLSDEGGEINMLFWPHWAISAATVQGKTLSEAEMGAIQAVVDITHRPQLVLNTKFRPGDIQYLNNYRILHSRTDYEDWPDPGAKRYLERIWLNTRTDRRFSPGFVDLHGPRAVLDGIATVPPDVLKARGHSVSKLS